MLIDLTSIIDTDKIGIEKDTEILASRNKLKDKKKLVEKEASLIKGVDHLTSIMK